MKPEINLPRVYSGKISLGKTLFPRAKVRSVTTAMSVCANLDRLEVRIYDVRNMKLFLVISKAEDALTFLGKSPRASYKSIANVGR